MTLGVPAAAERLQHVSVAAIEPNPRQPRRVFQAAKIEALALSIASQGVIQPLVVRPHPRAAGRFQLIAGERRLRAVQSLGWREAPVLVRQVPDETLLEVALVENLQREQLTPIEEAAAYRALLEQVGYTQEALAARVGKDRSTIANMMRLLALPLRIQEDLDEGRLTIGHARALLGLTQPDHQLALRAVVLERGLTVRQTEQIVQRERNGAARAAPPTAPPSALGRGPGREALQFAAVQEKLEQRLATRVAVHPGSAPEGAGRIEIEYYSLDDFNRLCDLLTR
jgi:ParB family chromosome partitioning protein